MCVVYRLQNMFSDIDFFDFHGTEKTKCEDCDISLALYVLGRLKRRKRKKKMIQEKKSGQAMTVDWHCMCTERWQDHDRSLPLDLVLTYDERVFDAVVQDLQSRYRMCSLAALKL